MSSLLKKQLEELFISGYVNSAPDDLSTRMKILFAYFGMGDEKYAKMEDLGSGHGMTKANVSLIKKRLDGKNDAGKPKLPGLHELENIIIHELDNNNGYKLYSNLLPSIIQSNLADKLEPFGLRNFQKHFNFGSNFAICNIKIEDAEKEDYENAKEFILAKKGIQEKLRDEIRVVRKLPGKQSKAGIYCLEAVYEDNTQFLIQLEDMKTILGQMDDVWHTETDNKFWYLVEKAENKKGNPLITTLKKIKKVWGEKPIKKELLINIMERFLLQRWSPSERERNQEFTLIPTSSIIQEYFKTSQFIDSHTYIDKYVFTDKLKDNFDLGDVEQGLWDHFRDRQVSTRAEIINDLKKLGKNLGGFDRSPLLVEVETSKKRGKYQQFTFITKISDAKFEIVEEDKENSVNGWMRIKKERGKFDSEQLDKEKGNKKIGFQGEKLVYHYLKQLKGIKNLEWVSSEYPNAPFDFTFIDDDNCKNYVDVKSTEGNFKTKIYISYNELLAMQEIQDNEKYQIYRVCKLDADQDYACLQISENLKTRAKEIIAILSKLPKGISSEGVSLNPNILRFGSEKEIGDGY